MKATKVRVDGETYANFKKKQKKMQEVYKALTGKQKRVPLTKVLKVSSMSPIYLSDGELVKVVKKRKIK